MITEIQSFSLSFRLELVTFNNPVDTGRKLNVLKTFNLRPVSTGNGIAIVILSYDMFPWLAHQYETFPLGHKNKKKREIKSTNGKKK